MTRWSSANKHRRRVSWRARRTARTARYLCKHLLVALRARGSISRADTHDILQTAVEQLLSIPPATPRFDYRITYDQAARRVNCVITELPVYHIDVTA